MAERTISAEVRAFLESMCVPGILATLGKGGAPVTSAVWFGFLGDDILVSTPAARTKARNARADSRVSFVVDAKERPYRGVAIEGEAEVMDDPDFSLVRSIAHRYLGPDPPQDILDRWAASERVALRIHPRRVRPWNIAPAGQP